MSEEHNRKLWADICIRLPRIRDEANVVQERGRYEELLADTRAGLDALAGWNALTQKIDRLLRNERTQVIREGDATAGKTPTWLRGQFRIAHRCPLGHCGRRVVAPRGNAPRCALFETEMEPDDS
ncbi:hypothetical protein [Amycolatopsis solani]|uniref:hypothetical protein n=1 Tax=Amycolatopsis solani TaxID=3028615 RepID=UPI0025B02A25|nr:hypothetical protein [Amycolatopsis sp. MEP2-6]